MVTTDVEHQLIQQLKEAGKLLSHPSTSTDELLHVLDQTEKLLSLVDQSPNDLMLEAFKPALKALVNENLLKHSNEDVRVSVAACLCEITRITAPDAPYNDDEMKAIFQLVVSTFENLSDNSSRSYNKRLSILDNVAKVRSCVIMLDLECEDLIVKTFDCFLKSMRDFHGDVIFSSMMNIMVLVLEESEDISVDMLKPLLASVKNNEEVLPVARKLGEGVLKKSADKVKPYLKETLRILGDSLDDYSQVLTNICEGITDVVEHNDESTSVQPQADESKVATESLEVPPKADETKPTTESSEKTAQVVIKTSEEPAVTEATVDTTSEAVKINGTKIAENTEEHSADKESTKKPEEALNHSDLNSKVDTDDSVAEKTTEVPASEPKPVESENVSLPDENDNKKVDLPKDDLPKEEKLPEQELNKTEPANASKSRSIPFKSRSKRTAKPKSKVESQDDDTPLIDVVLTKASEPISDSDVKSPKRARKKTTPFGEEDSKVTSDSDAKRLKTPKKKAAKSDSVAKKAKKTDAKGSEAKKQKKTDDDDEETDSDNIPLIQSAVRKDKNKVVNKPSEVKETIDTGSDSDDKLVKFSAKKGRISSSGIVKPFSKKKESSKKAEEKEQVKSTPENDGMDASPKTAVKTATSEGNSEEAATTGTKRKRGSAKAKATTPFKYDETLVGKKVKVWWPKDKTFYEGIIESFDSATKKHKVLYLDGEFEVLILKKQKWGIIEEYSPQIEEDEAEGQITEALPETPEKKKPKSSAKKPGRGLATKVAIKAINKPSKTVSKEGSKEGEVAKEEGEEVSKVVTENKQESLKIVYKSKRKSSEKADNDNELVSASVKESGDVEMGKEDKKSGKKQKKASA